MSIRLGDVMVKGDSGSSNSSSPSGSSSSGGSGIKLSSQDIAYLKKYATTSTKSSSKKRVVRSKQYKVTVKEQIKLPRRTKPESVKREYKTWAKTQQGAISNIRNAGIKGQIVSVKQVKK